MSLPFNEESWVWFGVVIWISFSRFVSRRMALGSFRAFQLDDYVVMLALCFYTTLIVTINIVAVTNSNLFPPNYDTTNLTQDDIDERTYGSKLILVVEECQCCVVWAAKSCLLIMYLRFTVLAKENMAIKILAGYVAGGFILMEILYLGVWCRPFYEYWAVPTDNVQCSAATNHLITNAVLNLSSDVAMLIVGLPIFIRVQIPLRRKIPLLLLFSLGIFVIIAAILNKIYSFTNPFGTEWVFWYVRESSTALIVANMPFVWALYRRIPGLRPSVKSFEAEETFNDSHSPTRPRKHLLNLDSIGMPTVSMSRDSSSIRGSDDMPIGPAGMSAEECLFHDYIATTGSRIPQGEVNPYTHPAMYTAMMKQKKARAAASQHFEPAFYAQPVGRPGIIPDLDAESEGTLTEPSSRKRSLGSFG